MKKQKTHQSIFLIVILSCLCIAGLPLQWSSRAVVAAAHSKSVKSKMSGDLKDKAKKKDTVRVIIQTTSDKEDEDSPELTSDIGRRKGSVRGKYQEVSAVAAEVPGDELEELSQRDDVAYISPDRPTQQAGHLEVTTGASLVRNYGTTATGKIDGRGIGIAILDSGVRQSHHAFLDTSSPNNLKSRIVASVNFYSGDAKKITDDAYGHGTHVAAIAAGNSHVANGAYTGIAPQANIINVRVLGNDGSGSTSDALAAIHWIIKHRAEYNIRVMNFSMGAVAVDSYTKDPLCKAAERAWKKGIVVVAAAGNSGKDERGRKIYGAIHSPGTDPTVITVGAVNTFGSDGRSDDGVATYSSRGPTRGSTEEGESGKKHFDNIIKPDLVAPGNKIISAEAVNSSLIKENPQLDVTTASNKDSHSMMYLSGTSMASPAVAGAAALIIQRNPKLTPNMVKAVLEMTAQPLAGFNTLEQGAGQLNVEGAVRLAGLIRTDLSANTLAGSPLLVGNAPAQRTTIAGYTFTWGGGLLQKWNVISGAGLLTKYQNIYGSDAKMSEGVMLAGGVMLNDGSLLTDGITLSEGVLLSDGTTLKSGSLFVSGITISEGVLLSDGVLMADGGKLTSDSTESGTQASATFSEHSVLIEGDPGVCMSAAQDNVNW